MPLPTNRSTSSTVQEHLDDHNDSLHQLFNTLEGAVVLGSPLNIIRVNAGGTGVEWATPSGTYAPLQLTQNAQTGTTYTLVLTDEQKLVELSNAAAITLTVPPNSSVAFPVGTQVHLLQSGAGQVTVAPGAGVTVNGTPGLKARAQWSAITLIKRATNTWVAIGDLAA